MLPAPAETVLFWSGGRRQVLVIHDEQSALTAGRLRGLQHILADAAGLAPGRLSPLPGPVTVDSRDDPRVQIADLLAGADDGPLRPFLSLSSLHDPGCLTTVCRIVPAGVRSGRSRRRDPH